MTKLAEQTFNEILLGRGMCAPLKAGVGSESIDTKSIFPLGELSRHELRAYMATIESTLNIPSATDQGGSWLQPSLDSTIEDLTHRYFEAVGEAQPNIVSNVVKTIRRLGPLPRPTYGDRCNVCFLPLPRLRDFRIELLKETPISDRPNEDSSSSCNGCSKTFGASIQSLHVSKQRHRVIGESIR